MRTWWEGHSFTGNVVSSLLVLGVTALIFDEVVARRQRQERAASVAVQGLIVYGQAVRAYNTFMADPGAVTGGAGVDAEHFDQVRDEARNLASMILVASAPLFDDPEARLFLEEVQRLTGLMYRGLIRTSPASSSADNESLVPRLKACRSRMDARVRCV